MAAPKQTLNPGWYWYHYMIAEDPAVRAFNLANRQMQVRITFRGETSGTQVIVFEVTAPLFWTLPGFPHVAPKKEKTRPQDLTTGPPMTPSLIVMIEEITGKPIAAVQSAAKRADTLITAVAIGAGAILLWNLFQNTRAPEAVEAGES